MHHKISGTARNAKRVPALLGQVRAKWMSVRCMIEDIARNTFDTGTMRTLNRGLTNMTGEIKRKPVVEYLPALPSGHRSGISFVSFRMLSALHRHLESG